MNDIPSDLTPVPNPVPRMGYFSRALLVYSCQAPKFWNLNWERLLQSLTLPNLREHYASAVQVAEHLASVNKTLLNQLKDLRLELSLRHDVPYVEIDRKLTA